MKHQQYTIKKWAKILIGLILHDEDPENRKEALKIALIIERYGENDADAIFDILHGTYKVRKKRNSTTI